MYPVVIHVKLEYIFGGILVMIRTQFSSKDASNPTCLNMSISDSPPKELFKYMYYYTLLA